MFEDVKVVVEVSGRTKSGADNVGCREDCQVECDIYI